MKRFSALTAGAVAAASIAVAAGGASAAGGGMPTLTLTMTGKKITATQSVPAGAVNVVSKVSGEPLGSPTLVLLNPGATFKQALGAVNSHHGQIDAINPYGKIVFNPQAAKGTSSAQTVLAPGNYVALDAVGNNPAKYPTANLTVTANSSPAKLPAAGAKVNMLEFAFSGPGTWHEGEVVRFTNIGYLYHMTIGLPVKNQAAAKKLTTALLTGKDRQAQKLVSGQPYQFVGSVGSGAVQQQKITAKPGYYVLACFMDTQDGREHTAIGMVRTIKITK